MTEVAYRLCRVSEPHGLDLLGLLFSHCLLEVSERRLPSGESVGIENQYSKPSVNLQTPLDMVPVCPCCKVGLFL